MRWASLLACLLCVGATAAGCREEPPAFSPRTRIGIVPEGFAVRPVSSAAGAAAYVDDYVRALGLEGVRAVRALGFEGAYWVYVAESKTGRAAFSVAVRRDGAVSVRQFPAMEPEMMWNQKYGHEARPDPTEIEGGVTPTEAETAARRALPEGADLRLGTPCAYYGYFLFPVCEGDRWVGEAAVNAVGGEVAWKRFPSPPLSRWAAPGTTWPCGGRVGEGGASAPR